MTKVYKHLNENLPDIMNDIFKFRENIYNPRNFHIFQTENSHSLKYGLNAIPFRASQLWQQVPFDVREAATLPLVKNRNKIWKCKDCPCKPSKIVSENIGYI